MKYYLVVYSGGDSLDVAVLSEDVNQYCMHWRKDRSMNYPVMISREIFNTWTRLDGKKHGMCSSFKDSDFDVKVTESEKEVKTFIFMQSL